MGTKAQEMIKAKHGEGCLGKARDDEPIFILRSTDATAPDLVRRWARQAEGHAPAKAEEAYQLADKMEEWANATGLAKLPD